MTAPVFVVDGARLRADDAVTLDGEEGRHAAVVRRIGAGEAVDLTDGAGQLAHCVVTAASKAGLVCAVKSRTTVAPPSPRLTVVQALAKGDRGELAVELMTEVGVDVIVPWAALRCVTRWKAERGEKSLRRWRSTAREAAKQSRRAWHPSVTPLATTDEVARLLAGADLAIVLHEAAELPLGAVELPSAGNGVQVGGATAPDGSGDGASPSDGPGELVLVVGPEGGVDDSELAAFEAAGAVSVRMGPTVLRTSTAGAVAAGVLLSRTVRWS